MTEPNTTAAAAATATVTAALAGSVLGLAYDALLGGLFGGLLSLMYQQPMPARRMAIAVGSATLFAAVLAPVAAATAVNFAPWLAALPAHVLNLAVAMVVGLAAQVAIPVGLAALRRKGDAA